MLNLDNMQLLESLQSKVCPACGDTKSSMNTFCGHCYRMLSHEEQRALYEKIGRGYSEAVENAMSALGKTEFMMPEVKP